MGMFRAIDSAASGLTAERFRLDVISNNIANANTTRTAAGGAYRRQMVVFQPRTSQSASFLQLLKQEQQALSGAGVRVVGIKEDQAPLRTVYDPTHPDANAQGYVEMPNVHIVTEMVDMIGATRAYEANVAAVNAAKSMALKALEIGR